MFTVVGITDGNQIKFISDPDKEVQLQQVNQNTYQIQWIKNPDIKVKLQQVSKMGIRLNI